MIGVGVETVGTDAGTAHSFDPAFPCHSYVLGAGKYGLTQLQNLARLPATGAVVIAGPLPIVSGSGSPARVLALVETVTRRGVRRHGAGAARRRARVRRRRQRQLPRHERAACRRGPVRRGPARGRRRDDGRRVGADGRPARGADGAPGLRADQRDDRHRRGREEPHPAARARRRDRRGRRPLELPHRPGRAGHGRRRGRRPGAHGRHRRPRTSSGPTGRPSSSGARWCSTCLSTCRPPPSRTPRCLRFPCSAPVRPAAGAVDELAALIAAAERPVFVAGRGARGAGRELRALGAASGALLATSAVAHGLFVGDEFVARHLRRVRLAAGRRADPRRRPGGRLGLRAEHVDDPARHAARSGRAGGAGRPRRGRDRDAPAGRPGRGRRRRGHRDGRPGRGGSADRLPDRRRPGRDRRARPVARRPVRRPDRRRPASTRGRSRSASTTCCPRERTVAVDSGNFMGYPSAYLAVPDEAGFCFTQAFQSIGLGLATADRRGAGPPGPARRRRVGRRWRADGRRRAGDRGAAGAPDGRGRLRRPRLRRRGAPLPRRGPRHRHLPRRSISPRSAADTGSRR